MVAGVIHITANPKPIHGGTNPHSINDKEFNITTEIKCILANMQWPRFPQGYLAN